ncbi:MAG: beta-glucosidase [Microbacter sp.]
MIKLFLHFFPLVFFFHSLHVVGAPLDPVIEKKVDKVMAGMSLDEKVGQMLQITLDVIGKGPNVFSSDVPFTLDPIMMDSVFNLCKIGSVINTSDNIPFSRTDWNHVISAIQKTSLHSTHIPCLYGIDAIHGATYTIGATFFPQQIAMGASFNRTLVEQSAAITAYETRASSIPWALSPILDMGRNPVWPRMWETFGEDPYLTSQLGVAMVKGYQGVDKNNIDQDHVGSCLKHFMGYGVPASGQDRSPANIPENELKEIHFQPFVEAVKAGALAVMVNSGIVNDASFHADRTYIADWLKKGLQFDGVVVTDWGDIDNLCYRDHIAATPKDAMAIAFNAGIDVAMIPYNLHYFAWLKELIQEKRIPMARVDDAVRRVLRLKFRLNLFDHPITNPNDYPEFGSAEHHKMALSTAEEAITLLKNKDRILPLKADARILVCGPNANSMRSLNGGWTLSWQGDKVDQYEKNGSTILQALKTEFGDSQVSYSPGVSYVESGSFNDEDASGIAEAVKAAADAQYIVLCLGENSYTESVGNLGDLYLSDHQQELALALSKLGKPMILILNEGRPRLISKIEPLFSAVVDVYLPGSFGGEALARILSGKVNPSGKLPFTYPKYPNDLMTYDHKPSQDATAQNDIQYPFGFGLSYTHFKYSQLHVSPTSFKADDTIHVSVNVTNDGSVAGKETVLLFSTQPIASITPDVKRLRGFEKVFLQPGETKTVTMTIKAMDLAYVDLKGQWRLEPGEFILKIADQQKSMICMK